MVNKTSLSPENFESQEGKGIFWKIEKFVKRVESNVKDIVNNQRIRYEWKEKVLEEFRKLSPEKEKKVKDCLLTYFKQGNADPNLFYLPNGKRVDTVNHHVLSPDSAKMDAVIDQIRPYFENVDWSDKNLNRTIFDFLEELGIQVRPSISPLRSRIWLDISLDKF